MFNIALLEIFITKSVGERILKIGQHFAPLGTRVRWHGVAGRKMTEEPVKSGAEVRLKPIHLTA